MAELGRATRLSRLVDDYVEDVAVGTPWWILILAFGAGFPLVSVAILWLFHARYPISAWSLILVGGLTGVALKLIARERERSRAAAVGRSGDLAALRDLSWQEFEVVVGEVIRRQGFTVKQRGGFEPDGGVDLIVEGHRGQIVVQCKQWRSWPVSMLQVKALYATVKADNFQEGWLVTCGRFSDRARQWAKGKEIRLIDGPQLLELYAPQGTPEFNRASTRPVAAEVPAGPSCPDCGLAMRRQTNKDDRSTFWGCTGYPACRFTADDPPETHQNVTCQRGHVMIVRKTKRGIPFWGCSSYPSCRRKRLLAKAPIRSG